ncbi:MAG: hypothetical protein QOG49_73, partial [Frankiaceae bacterium]|nr:hypothetical protein [Frankiaceae bacterium]
LFRDRVDEALQRNETQDRTGGAVLFLDLDGFKEINDSLGHAAGDLLLARVSERLRGQLRATDTAARIGGDEFAVLLTDLTDLDLVPMIVERIHAALAVPHDIEGHRVVVTASIGIATSGGGHLAPEELLRHSDLAMYRAKTARRGTSATYDISMSSHAEERLLRAHSGVTVPVQR